MAFPRPAVPGGAGAPQAIHRLATAEGVSQVIVGLPLNMDGTAGSQAATARAFGEQLEALGLRVSYADERLTTWAAGDQLAESGIRPSTPDAIDSAAAVLILEQHLADRRRHSEEP